MASLFFRKGGHHFKIFSFRNLIKTPIKLFNKSGPLKRFPFTKVDWNSAPALKTTLTFRGLFTFFTP